ncbi:MAG: phosphotransferase, partial [Clostridia bacterium]|nr:phosphotransferase [Clostridia bacterium]
TDLFDESIRLQILVNDTHCYLPIRVEEKIKTRIEGSRILDSGLKNRLICIADNLTMENCLCHGDFHAKNLIRTNEGIAIIDWIDASIGDPRADACRTYLLYELYYKEYAEYYLNKYCYYKNIRKEDILAILPAVAGARLSEGNESEYPSIFEAIRKYS